MLKKQETVMLSSSSSSSSRRQNLRDHQTHHSVKPIGCMSGILHLLSKHHPRHKFLTLGRKQGKNGDAEVPINSSTVTQIRSSSSATLQDDHKKKNEDGGGDKILHGRRLSCQVPRSPTLPPEIRQSNSVDSPENFSFTATTIGPRGRDDKEMINPTSATSAAAAAEEKRRKLLGALEKCDEDLKAIGNIIEAFRSTKHDSHRSVEVETMCMKGTNGEKFDVSGKTAVESKGPVINVEENLKMINEEKIPSAISVFDDFLPPLSFNNTSFCFPNTHITNGQMMQQQKPQLRMNPREEDMITSTCFFHRLTTSRVSVSTKHEIVAWSSKAINESVVQVCKDMECGEKREVTRIGLVLQDYIFRDLVDQVVYELLLLGISTTSNCLYSVLPLEACKKRLRF